jgi:hypothetical protein
LQKSAALSRFLTPFQAAFQSAIVGKKDRYQTKHDKYQ